MFTLILSAAVCGLDVRPIQVEADVSDGLPQFVMVGDLSPQVREAQDRVRTAFRNSGISFPAKRITVNLSPADIPKRGPRFDLPIALAILAASGEIPADALKGVMAVGELSLNGTTGPVTGVLPTAAVAKKSGVRALLIPAENIIEASVVSGPEMIGVRSLSEAVRYLRDGVAPFPSGTPSSDSRHTPPAEDFSDIRGQAAAVRAAVIAAAGFHNLLLIGPPGSGKTMLARRVPHILPALTRSESLEIARIYSIAGLLDRKNPSIAVRPFRHPHHTISPQALAGGGYIPTPGEVTLSHRGVLFLDEFPEFSRRSLEILRQPLEDREIVISRTTGTFRFPASFLLLAAMNPCPCGHFPDMNRCTCSPRQISMYLNRVSKPLLDRIDLCAECPEISYDDLFSGEGTTPSSAKLRSLVERAFKAQRERFRGTGIRFNSEIPSSKSKEFCEMDEEAQRTLACAYREMRLSARSYYRILRVSRTIADLADSPVIRAEHLREALLYRVIDQKYWRL